MTTRRETLRPAAPATRGELEMRRIMRHLRMIAEDAEHPLHLQLIAIADLSIAVELHNEAPPDGTA